MSAPVKTFSCQGLHGRYTSAEPIRDLLSGSQSVANWFAQCQRELKTTPKLSARLLGDVTQCWFVKAYYPRGILRKLSVLMGRNHADRVFDHSMRLLEMGVSVPRPLAVFREGGWYCVKASYYVSEALTHAQDLRQTLDLGQFDNLNHRHRLLDQVADSLARLHEAGYAHGDMKWANIMFSPESGQLWFIDLDGLARPRLFRASRYARDLARFLVNARAFAVEESAIQDFVARYAFRRGCSVSGVWRAIEPPYNKLAERHRRQYGARL